MKHKCKFCQSIHRSFHVTVLINGDEIHHLQCSDAIGNEKYFDVRVNLSEVKKIQIERMIRS